MAVVVRPGEANPTHHISLSDGKQTWGLILERGGLGIQEIPRRPSTLIVPSGENAWGDFEPGMAQVVQKDFLGGRGQRSLDEDATRYYDANMVITMVQNQAFPAPLLRFAEGLVSANNKMPGAAYYNRGDDVKWADLSTEHYAHQLTTPSAGAFTMGRVQIIVRKIGATTANLVLKLRQNNAGNPGTAIGTAVTLDPGNLERDVSAIVEIAITDWGAQSNSTTYWLEAYADSAGTPVGHWEIGVGILDADQAKKSADGTTWENTPFGIYFRIAAAAADLRKRFFIFRSALYAITVPANSATASQLYLNGYRGKATSATATTLTDTNAAFIASLLSNRSSYIYISTGKGQGQYRLITANTGTQVTVAAWDVTPDTTSCYVIYSADIFNAISTGAGDGFDQPIKGGQRAILVVDDEVWFARGTLSGDQPILRMRWNDGAATPIHEFDDDGTNKADLLYFHTELTNGPQIWRADNSTISVARGGAKPAWLTAIVFGTAIPVGDDSNLITNLHDYNGDMHAIKQDDVYRISSDKAIKEDTGLGQFRRSLNNGEAIINNRFYAFLSHGEHTIVQYQKNASIVDMGVVGPDLGEGLPEERSGPIRSLGALETGIMAGIDAGNSGVSSILTRTEPAGWHEMVRSPIEGWRIRDFNWQDCPGTFPRLWVDCGNEVLFQEWPRNSLNPRKDSGIKYQWETQITQSDITMGLPRLAKYLKEISLLSENLSKLVKIIPEYQLDKAIGGTIWTKAGEFVASPADVVKMNRGGVFRVRVRFRLLTEDSSTPPVILAAVLEGFARTPAKYQWNAHVKVRSIRKNLAGEPDDQDPDKFIAWLKDSSQNAKRLLMRSLWAEMDNVYVIVEPPTVLRSMLNKARALWGGSVTITLLET